MTAAHNQAHPVRLPFLTERWRLKPASVDKPPVQRLSALVWERPDRPAERCQLPIQHARTYLVRPCTECRMHSKAAEKGACFLAVTMLTPFRPDSNPTFERLLGFSGDRTRPE